MKYRISMLAVMLLYVIKVIVVGFYQYPYIDLALWISLLLLIFVIILKHLRKDGINKRSFIIRNLSIIIITIVLISVRYYAIFSVELYHEKEENFPWAILNNFDEGYNTKITSINNVGDKDSKVIFDDYINEEVFQSENYRVSTLYVECKDSTITYIPNGESFTSSDKDSCLKDGGESNLQFLDYKPEYILSVTYHNSKLYSITKPESSSTKYVLTVHDNSGNYIESKEYDNINTYSSINFAKYSTSDNLHIVVSEKK